MGPKLLQISELKSMLVNKDFLVSDLLAVQLTANEEPS